MLSRVANDLYWMSRYVERAENIARFIEVNWHMMLDMPDSGSAQWAPLVNVTGDTKRFEADYGEPSMENVIRFLVFDENYANSIISCVTRARENARAVRDQISPDMWEEVNMFYHVVKDAAENPSFIHNTPQDFLHLCRHNGAEIGGLADDTMTHGEGWLFFRLARLLERAEKTSRILDVKYFILLPEVDYVGSAYDVIQWAALLRSTSSLETFRHTYGRINPDQVVEFLLLDRAFPRSVQACLDGADDALRAISGTQSGLFTNPAERALGQVRSELAYTDSHQIVTTGLHEFLDGLQIKLNQIDMEIYRTFFDIQPLAGHGIV